MIELDFTYKGNINLESCQSSAIQARQQLIQRSGAGHDFLGWLDLPEQINVEQIAVLKEKAAMLAEAQTLVVVGIGGSYLGARAVLEALQPAFTRSQEILFAGHQMDARYHTDLMAYLKNKDFAVNIISKSGTTTEPGLAFRMLWQELQKNSADKITRRVVATTDRSRGSLRLLTDEAGLDSFVIPDDVGGRFSVFTPVGLLPIAVGGLDIARLLEGARAMRKQVMQNKVPEKNPALMYAMYRNACYRAGKKIEIMASYQQGLAYIAEWWKQLFGESEGKGGKGIFPASVSLSTDLHSMGQWMQDGERSIFETVLDVVDEDGPVIEEQTNNADNLNYLAGRTLHAVNRTALEATLQAHADGGVPCLRILLPERDEYYIGALLYMYEFACGISAYMLDVNPFDQPGVEAYKTKMFKLLGRP